MARCGANQSPLCSTLKGLATGAHAWTACRGGRIHTQWGCREVLYEEGPQGAEATGLRMTKAGKEQIVEADVYVAALDVPGTLPIPLCGHCAPVCMRLSDLALA